MRTANGRRKFLKLMGASAAASAATVVPVQPTQSQEITQQLEKPNTLLCLNCETEVARYPKSQPRLCFKCRAWSYKPLVRDGLIDPSPAARKRYGLPQQDGTYVLNGVPYEPRNES
jgi:hypothetical protein